MNTLLINKAVCIILMQRLGHFCSHFEKKGFISLHIGDKWDA
jgi:hypothetical protein